jgi:5-methylcytosine-specific restriction endonuclease McrA
VETRVCKVCNRELELETNFYKRAVTRKDGTQTYILRCHACEYKRRKASENDSLNSQNYKLEWQRNNPEKTAEYRKKYHATEHGKETHRAKMRRYYASEYGQKMRRIRDAQRKARKKNAEGRYTTQDVAYLYELQEARCAYCDVSLEDTGYHVDHVIPLAKGGTNYPSNLALACPRCNMEKHDKLLEEWLLDRHS